MFLCVSLGTPSQLHRNSFATLSQAGAALRHDSFKRLVLATRFSISFNSPVLPSRLAVPFKYTKKEQNKTENHKIYKKYKIWIM